jgi:hypothetical protein
MSRMREAWHERARAGLRSISLASEASDDMTFAKDDLIAALRMRYDYYSAESVFDIARTRAELTDKASYEPAEVRSIREVLPSCGDRLTAVLARFDELLEAAPAGKGDAPKKAEPKPEPKPEPAKAEAKPEAKPEPKPEPEPAKAEPAKAEPAKTEAVETTIVLTGVTVGDDEQVLISGDGELGDWDPARAKPMSRTGDQWLTTVKVAPDADLACKFLRRTADGKVTWEDGDNRTLPAKPRHEVTWR